MPIHKQVHTTQCLATSITWMFPSNAQGECTIVSSCRVCYYFHHSSPCWFTKSLHIVVSIQPAGEHLRQTIPGFPRVAFLNHVQMSRVNSETSANCLPTTSNWHHLCQYIKVIILSYQKEVTSDQCNYPDKCIITHLQLMYSICTCWYLFNQQYH